MPDDRARRAAPEPGACRLRRTLARRRSRVTVASLEASVAGCSRRRSAKHRADRAPDRRLHHRPSASAPAGKTRWRRSSAAAPPSRPSRAAPRRLEREPPPTSRYARSCASTSPAATVKRSRPAGRVGPLLAVASTVTPSAWPTLSWPPSACARSSRGPRRAEARARGPRRRRALVRHARARGRGPQERAPASRVIRERLSPRAPATSTASLRHGAGWGPVHPRAVRESPRTERETVRAQLERAIVRARGGWADKTTTPTRRLTFRRPQSDAGALDKALETVSRPLPAAPVAPAEFLHASNPAVLGSKSLPRVHDPELVSRAASASRPDIAEESIRMAQKFVSPTVGNHRRPSRKKVIDMLEQVRDRSGALHPVNTATSTRVWINAAPTRGRRRTGRASPRPAGRAPDPIRRRGPASVCVPRNAGADGARVGGRRGRLPIR